ncbi:MAG TPA: DUF1501 domain-containing protein [Bryobacteraceae bacterium]|nr:DUF1501 domain-containing protein [Bryobacteraceae bacterium]
MTRDIPNVPSLTRRHFFRTGSVTVAGYWLAPMIRPLNVMAKENVTLRGGAEYCIFLFLNGGASQLDSFDIKEGKWTPPDFDVRTVKPGIRLPYSLFPQLSGQLDHLVIARSVEAWESAHSRAQYYMQVGHPFSPARRNEMPAMGAVIASEFAPRRKDSDFLPPFVAMNFSGTAAGLVRQGCLPYGYGPLPIEMKQGTEFVIDPGERAVFDRRWQLRQALESAVPGSQPSPEFDSFYQSALGMMTAPRLAETFHIPEEDRVRYGSSTLGDSCILARNLVRSEAGSHFISISHNGWDLHADMFDPKNKRNHYGLTRELDAAFASLVSDLAKTRARDGRTLLEKTFIVCMGEFGRTGGELTVNKGRDHNRSAFSAVFAGAGVKGGRAFGVTDANGVKVLQSEWDEKRSIYPEDVIVTVYSLLGIDWTKKIVNTPSGRAFEYIEQQSGTDFVHFREISNLFA